ncbi:hypothetical protein BSR28_07000 [Boudabousia liubingyangii]|nr:hypothetical protein BSR28_07000 [Boudabousia liubingyangii]
MRNQSEGLRSADGTLGGSGVYSGVREVFLSGRFRKAAVGIALSTVLSMPLMACGVAQDSSVSTGSGHGASTVSVSPEVSEVKTPECVEEQRVFVWEHYPTPETPAGRKEPLPAWALEKPKKYDPKNFPNTVEGKEAFAKYFLETLIHESNYRSVVLTENFFEEKCESCLDYKTAIASKEVGTTRVWRVKSINSLVRYSHRDSEALTSIERVLLESVGDGEKNTKSLDYGVTVVSKEGPLYISRFSTTGDFKDRTPSNEIVQVDE